MGGATVLVTGASGFIGRRVCRQLADAGAVVHGVYLRSGLTLGHHQHCADLTDADTVRTLIARVQPHYVFHLAGHVTAAREVTSVRPTFDTLLGSTVHLLTALQGTHCRRVVLAGSLEEPDDGSPPSSPYAAAKAASTLYARMFWHLYGVPVVLARIFMTYGPGQPDRRKLVPYVIDSLRAGDAPRLSSGVRPVDWVHVDDVAEALVRCACEPDLLGRTFDVGTGRVTTVREVVERLHRILGGPAPVFGALGERPAEQVKRADPSHLRALLGREPIDLDAGLRRTVDEDAAFEVSPVNASQDGRLAPA
jgi:nucleoside-diphosphate-sugar epimerase